MVDPARRERFNPSTPCFQSWLQLSNAYMFMHEVSDWIAWVRRSVGEYER